MLSKEKHVKYLSKHSVMKTPPSEFIFWVTVFAMAASYWKLILYLIKKLCELNKSTIFLFLIYCWIASINPKRSLVFTVLQRNWDDFGASEYWQSVTRFAGFYKSCMCVRDICKTQNIPNCCTWLSFNKYAHKHTSSVFWVCEATLIN